MHNAALAKLAAADPGLAGHAYFKFDIPPERLAEALPLFHRNGFLGLNLTLPHKVEAVSLVTQISAPGEAAGAVNTLVRDASGYSGDNTDGLGFARACEVRLGVRLAGAQVVLLGAGGAARAVATAALAAGCASLLIVNRDPARLRGLLDRLAASNIPGCLPLGVAPDAIPGDLPAGALVVNATGLGLKADDPSPFPARLLRPGVAVYDTVYGAHTTTLVREARAAGLRAEDGLSMLCWQGALALETWLGRPAPVAEMWAAIGGEGRIL
jgi:shikimate dehydrogenase